jgi:hypothetical protein
LADSFLAIITRLRGIVSVVKASALFSVIPMDRVDSNPQFCNMEDQAAQEIWTGRPGGV